MFSELPSCTGVNSLDCHFDDGCACNYTYHGQNTQLEWSLTFATENNVTGRLANISLHILHVL